MHTPRDVLCATLAAAAACLAAPAHAGLVIGSAGQTYQQNFDTLPTTGTAAAWANDSTLAGWSLFNATGAPITAIAAGDGSSNTGSFYSFGSAGSTDRALGGLASGGTYFGSPASGAVAGWMAAAFTNTSGKLLQGFLVAYDGEQWRNGGNTTAQSMAMQYGYGSTFASVSSWVTAAQFTSPVTGATAAAVNGNVAGRVPNVGGVVGAPWADGQTLWLRWTENNDAGNDHGLAIDNFVLTAGAEIPSAVPLPAPFGLMALSLAGMAWVARRRRD